MVFQLAGKPFPSVVAEVVSHEEVIAIGEKKADVMKNLVEMVVEMIPSNPDL